MDSKDKMIINIRKGKLILALTNILAALCLFAAYNYSKNVLFLIAALVMALAAVAALVVFKRLEKKFSAMTNRISNIN
jgi:hypothetical protein